MPTRMAKTTGRRSLNFALEFFNQKQRVTFFLYRRNMATSHLPETSLASVSYGREC
jgi:hypothetical protein